MEKCCCCLDESVVEYKPGLLLLLISRAVAHSMIRNVNGYCKIDNKFRCTSHRVVASIISSVKEK